MGIKKKVRKQIEGLRKVDVKHKEKEKIGTFEQRKRVKKERTAYRKEMRKRAIKLLPKKTRIKVKKMLGL